jgi:acetyl esterase/lipase
MQTPTCWLRALRQSAHSSRPISGRQYVRYIPEGTNSLEERVLLSSSIITVSSPDTHPPAQIRSLAPVDRRSAISFLAASGFATSAVSSRVTDLRHQPTAASKQAADSVFYSNIPYTDQGGQLERLDVYVPRGPAPLGGWPVIVAIHGGGWRRFNKDEYGPRIASAFVSHGYVVVAPNYHLSSPGHPTWPLNFEEIQSAVRWVRNYASQFGINPGQVVAMGESAGANLANLLGNQGGSGTTAGTEVSSLVEAVVSFSSPTDLAALYSESPQAGKAVAQFLGGPPTAVPGNYVAASPVDQVSPSSAPTLLIHGGNDPLVPVGQSIELAQALTAAGVRNDLVILPGGGHDLNFPAGTPQNLFTQILEFLDATWKDRRIQSQTIKTQ